MWSESGDSDFFRLGGTVTYLTYTMSRSVNYSAHIRITPTILIVARGKHADMWEWSLTSVAGVRRHLDCYSSQESEARGGYKERLSEKTVSDCCCTSLVVVMSASVSGCDVVCGP